MIECEFALEFRQPGGSYRLRWDTGYVAFAEGQREGGRGGGKVEIHVACEGER